MIKLHHIFRLVFGFAMVEFCRFFYYQPVYRGPSYEKFTPSAPSLSAEQQKLLNVTPSSKYQGFYQVGDQNIYLSGNKAYQQDQSGLLYLAPLGTNTRFKEYEGDITGFNRDKDAGTYSPSMAYLSALTRANTPYVPFSAQQSPLSGVGYNPALGLGQTGGIYQASTGDLLSAPSQVNLPTGPMYGAGRFLNNTTNGLLNFSAPQTTGNTYNNSYTPQSGYLTPPNMFFDRLNATNVPILNLFGTLGNAGALNNMSYTNTDTGFSGTVGEAQQMSGQ